MNKDELFSSLNSIVETNKTVDIQIGDKKLSYDPNLWRPIDVPEEFRFKPQYDKSIQYIGPVVDGAVVQEFPWINEPISMYKTYANLDGLTKCPRIPKRHTYRVFEGCTNIDTIIEQRWPKAWDDDNNEGGFIICDGDELTSYGCGCAHGGLYDGVISDKLIEYSTGTPTYSIIDWLGLDESLKETYIDLYGSKFKEVIGTLTPEMNISKSCFTAGGLKIECKVIHKSSELTKYGIKILSPKVIVNALTPQTPIDDPTVSYSICVLANDFVNDAGRRELFEICGYNLIVEEYNGNIDARSSTINVAIPNCTINAETPINTNVEELTIKSEIGSTLVLKSGDRQPCIGPETDTKLSSGGWCKTYRRWIKKIILDNVHVICDNAVSNFSIGMYGIEDVPEIVLLNGATIECPEVHGTRIMNVIGESSLKSSADVEYYIV